MTRLPLLGAVVSLLFLTFPSVAWGCKCAQVTGAPPKGSLEAVTAGLASYDVVFVGKVTRMPSRVRMYLQYAQYFWKTRGDRELSEEEDDKMFRRRIRFIVETPFKGVTGARTSVYTGWGIGDCGYHFRRGERYLVYAMSWDDWPYTGICHATKPLAEAGREMEILESLVAGSKAP